MEHKLNPMMVEREKFSVNEKEYFSYYVKGKIRGKEVKVAVNPPDNGGYAVLDIVFGNSNKAELVVNPFEIKDEAGKVISGNTYAVRSVDLDGTVYECPVKPARKSDKSLLKMLLN